MLTWLTSGIGAWLSGGLIAAVIAGSLYLWHRSEYVPRAELEQWKEYSNNLAQAYAKREEIIQQFEEEKKADDVVIEQMIKDLDDARAKEASGDDPVVLDADSVERLHNFLKR